MKLEISIDYLLDSSSLEMNTTQIARVINERKLNERQQGKAPVTDKQVYVVIMSRPDIFVK